MAAQARQTAIAWLAHCERIAGRPDPTEGSEPLPEHDELDTLFGPGSRAWVRRRVFREISDLPEVMDGDAWPVALRYADDSVARRRMWRIGLRHLRKRRPLTGLRVAAGLLGLRAVRARETV